MSEHRHPLVMVCGTFDLLHPGHVFFIEEAKRHGHVIVVVARDETVKRIKGKLPAETLGQRMAAVERRFPDVTVVEGSASDFLESLRKHRPDTLLLGYDQKLPPGVTEADVLCPILRAGSHRPELFKSSLMKRETEAPNRTGKRSMPG
ncbi:MAG: adenylyltransferase/cytidyltransferase family protein [Candidatus Peribacteraceae bacterium]|nr:adenylyltransferase/cytidyltransferase family protein [Candidatus Peribacteraceae bacterium]